MPIETILVLTAVVAAFGLFAAVLLHASHQTDVMLRARSKGRA